MADRCYLEKCRDRLYPEFVLGGVAAAHRQRRRAAGSLQLRTGSAAPDSGVRARDPRRSASKASSNTPTAIVEPLFGGKNPYLEAIDRNLGYLHRVLRTERWPMLRRNPPLFTSERQSARSGARADAESPEGALGLGLRIRRLRPVDAPRRSARAAPRAASSTSSFPSSGAPRDGLAQHLRTSRRRRAVSAIGAKLKCQGSGCTPDARPERAGKIRSAAAFVSKPLRRAARRARPARTPPASVGPDSRAAVARASIRSRSVPQ